MILAARIHSQLEGAIFRPNCARPFAAYRVSADKQGETP